MSFVSKGEGIPAILRKQINSTVFILGKNTTVARSATVDLDLMPFLQCYTYIHHICCSHYDCTFTTCSGTVQLLPRLSALFLCLFFPLLVGIPLFRLYSLLVSLCFAFLFPSGSCLSVIYCNVYRDGCKDWMILGRHV